ncbi:MAG: hypothetical protein PXY39_15070 [archaeon]|nr:hypothetical protein [archaeon]
MLVKDYESQRGKPSARKLNLKVLLAIAGFALVVKLVIFFVSIKTSMGFSLPNIENWQDFSLAYVPAVNAFKTGFLPYVNFYYPYPPLFLYALTIFSYLPFPSWSSAIPLVIADALTVIPVYLIAREFVSERYSLIISTLFIIAPTALYYVDYLWLNPSLTTFFLMLSIYFLIKRHCDLSAVTLALSIGFKQTALLVVPVFLFIIWRRYGSLQTLRYLFLAASMCFLISLPFILMSPTFYLDSVFKVPQGLWPSVPSNYYTLAAGTGTAVSINTLNAITAKWQVVASGVNNPNSLALPIFIFLLPSSDSQVYSSNAYDFFVWVILIGVYGLFLYKTATNKEIDERDSLRYILYGLLIPFAFYASYKYYVVGIIPILALLVRNKRDAAGFIAFNLILMLIPRYLSSWVLLIALIWLFRAHFYKRYFTYTLVASLALLVAFVPFVASSSVISPYKPSVPVCASSGPVPISAATNFTESCELLPMASINQSSYIQSSGGASASFTVVSNSGLPFNIMIKDNTNGGVLFDGKGVTNASSSVNLAYQNSYSLIISNDSNMNNTITISSEVTPG